MTAIITKTFKGRIPRLSEKLLPDGFAQTAENCDLRRGKLESLKGLTAVTSTYGTADSFSGVRHLIRLNNSLSPSSAMAWCAAPSGCTDASFVRAQIANSGNRIYAVAHEAAYPVQTNSTLYAADTWYPLGIVAPTTAPTLTVRGSPPGDTIEIASWESGCSIEEAGNTITTPSHSYTFQVDDIVVITGAAEADNKTYYLTAWGTTEINVDGIFSATDTDVAVTVSRSVEDMVADSVSYVYTRVHKWDDGSEQESAPSDPTDVTDLYEGQGIKLTGLTAASAPDLLTTHFRVYRLAAGTNGAEYQLLTEVTIAAYATAGGVYDDSDVTEDEGAEHGLLDVQADVLETTDWEPPPDDLKGLMQYSNGILAGFVGNKLYISEPFVGYAWPSGYTMTFDYDIVALAVYNESLLVLTEGFPYVVTGLDPQSMSQTILPYEQACLSPDGVVVTNVGVVYPSPDGLFLLTASSGKLLTKEIYTKEQWAALTPANLISFFYDDQYLGFFRGAGTGILFNFKENPYVVDISISGASITGGYLDPIDDTLYLVNGSSLSSWGTGAALSFTWKSGVFRPGDASNYSCAAVVADGSVTFKLYADDTLQATKTVTTEEMFRLPGGYRAREFEIELSGSNTIDSVAIGHFPGELL